MSPLILLLPLILIVFGIIQQRRLARKHRRLLLRQLRTWIGEQGSTDPHLKQWVNGLSASEADVLLDLLTGYCSSLNWELSWLFAPQLHTIPVLKRAIEEGVMAYMRSILTSLQLVEDVKVYTTYVDLLRKPTARKQSTLVEKLYQAMGEQGVITPIAKKRRWFRRVPTRKQKISAIFGAFENKPVAAVATLKTMLANEGANEFQQLTGATTRLAGAM